MRIFLLKLAELPQAQSTQTQIPNRMLRLWQINIRLSTESPELMRLIYFKIDRKSRHFQRYHKRVNVAKFYDSVKILCSGKDRCKFDNFPAGVQKCEH